MTEIMTVSTKGQITLPSRIRASRGIKAGDRIIGEQTPEGFILKKPGDFAAGDTAAGALAEPLSCLSQKPAYVLQVSL
jgi:AbrB family looped-hinge helix DNA binding protein